MAGHEELQERIAARIADLEREQRHLRRRSTISFVERRELGGRTTRAVESLRAQQAALSEESADAAREAAETALTEADAVLAQVIAAQPAGLQRRSQGGHRMPGEHRQGGA